MTVTIDEPIELFRSWLKEAEDAEPINPNAMTLATVDAEGRPSARMVLLKDVDEKGFVFYTNLASRKADDLGVNLNAALCFYWKTLAKQVRVEGAVAPVSDVEADEYFASRAKLSQLGAWASKQSQPLEGRMALEKRVARYTAKFNIGTVPGQNSGLVFALPRSALNFGRKKPSGYMTGPYTSAMARAGRRRSYTRDGSIRHHRATQTGADTGQQRSAADAAGDVCVGECRLCSDRHEIRRLGNDRFGQFAIHFDRFPTRCSSFIGKSVRRPSRLATRR